VKQKDPFPEGNGSFVLFVQAPHAFFQLAEQLNHRNSKKKGGGEIADGMGEIKGKPGQPVGQYRRGTTPEEPGNGRQCSEGKSVSTAENRRSSS